MARKNNEYEPIATMANINTYRQPTVTRQQPQYDFSNPNTDIMQKLQQNDEVTPNPVPQTQGGAMTQNANGINAQGGGNAMTQPPSGMMGVRNELNNRGIYDIGWNDTNKTFTVGGQEYKPGAVQDGTSYSNESDINKITNEYYRQQGKPLEGADAYVAQALGVKNAVSWSNGNLMVGGQIVPTVYVDGNGTAYAQKSALDSAIAAYRNSTGLKGNQSVIDDYNSRYGNQINKALGRVMNREEWSYNPENDAAYRSYRDQYTREGDRAYQNAYADMATSTGGYGSSAAMNAAGQQWNYYMQQLGDRIPELQQNDYNRYLGEYNLRRNELNSLRDVANDYYNREYQANRDIINDLNAANEASYQRRFDARKLNRADYESDRVYPYQEKLLQQQVAQGDMDTERYGRIADLNIQNQENQNRMQELEIWNANFQKILTSIGYSDRPITETEALEMGVNPKADGTYPTGRELMTAYGELQSALEAAQWPEQRRRLIETWQINNGIYGTV